MKLSRRIHPNSYFVKLVLSYSVLAVVLVCTAGIFLYNRSNAMVYDEISREGTGRVKVIRDYLDSNLLAKYEDALYNRSFSTISSDQQDVLNYLMGPNWNDYIYQIMLLSKNLNAIALIHEGVYNVTFYATVGNFAVDRNYMYSVPNRSTDAVFIQSLRSMPDKKWFNRVLPQGEEVMTYVVPLPYGISVDKARGFIFVDVGIDHIQQAFVQLLNAPLEKLIVFDHAGGVVLQTDETLRGERENFARTLSAMAAGVEVRRTDGGNEVVSYLKEGVKPGELGFALVRKLDLYALSGSQFQRQMLAICGLLLALGLTFAYLISRRFYLPLKRILLKIRDAYSGAGSLNDSRNEYSIIDNTLRSMDEKIHSLQLTVRLDQMRNFLLGHTMQLPDDTLLGEWCKCIVVLIRTQPELAERFRENYELVRHPFNHLLVEVSSSSVVIIVALDNGDRERDLICDDLEKFRLMRRELLPFRWSMGVPVSADALPESYRMACEAERYLFLLEDQPYVAYADIGHYSEEPLRIDYDALKLAIKAGNETEIGRFAEQFAGKLAQPPRRLEVVELALAQLSAAIAELIVELKLQHVVSSSELLKTYKKTTLRLTAEGLQQTATALAIYMKESQGNRHVDTIHKLRQYIHDHLAEDLSLNTMAEIVFLSPAYVSTLFGEVLHISFSDYLINARMERAAELLRCDPSLSVAKVGEQVGYHNPQYFSTKFKVIHGVTPVQYRSLKSASTAPLSP